MFSHRLCLAAFICSVLLGAGTIFAAGPVQPYGEKIPPPAEAAALERQAFDRVPLLPTPVPGNPIHYWHDTDGNVLGVSRKGQIVWLEMPAGDSQIGTGLVHSGFGIDYEPINIMWDIYDYWGPNVNSDFQRVSYKASPKGAAAYPGTPLTVPLKVVARTATANGLFRLKNVVKWTPKTMSVTLISLWKNVSDGDLGTVAPKYFWDVDLNGGESTPLSHFSRTDRGGHTWFDPTQFLASHHYSLSISAKNPPNIDPKIYSFTGAGFIDAWGNPSGLVTGSPPSHQGDDAIGINTYSGPITMPPGGKKRDVFHILVH